MQIMDMPANAMVLIANENSAEPLGTCLVTNFIRNSNRAMAPPDSEVGKIGLMAIGKNFIRSSVIRKGGSRKVIDKILTCSYSVEPERHG